MVGDELKRLNGPIFITGHTGFKGSWLSLLLNHLGIEHFGYSLEAEEDSLYLRANLERVSSGVVGDIRDLENLSKVIKDVRPSAIIHLAAQPLVLESYQEPLETFQTNCIGTANVLKAAFETLSVEIVLVITTDKVYRNNNSGRRFVESDPLEGKDPYSASKVAAEAVCAAWQQMSKILGGPKVLVARAGNVIGGGDWAKDRIVVDSILAWNNNKKVEIRSPKSTRPWQHVLEPLSGYLALGEQLYENLKLNGEPFNFGPKAEQNRSVVDLLSDMGKYWGFTNDNKAFEITGEMPFHEASLLKLNCDKALFHLKWESTLHYEENISFVSKWYYAFYKEKVNIYDFTQLQIDNYEKLAFERNKKWTLIQK